MALDINTGYSSAFKTFVDFAEKTHADGHDSAAARTRFRRTSGTRWCSMTTDTAGRFPPAASSR